MSKAENIAQRLLEDEEEDPKDYIMRQPLGPHSDIKALGNLLQPLGFKYREMGGPCWEKEAGNKMLSVGRSSYPNQYLLEELHRYCDTRWQHEWIATVPAHQLMIEVKRWLGLREDEEEDPKDYIMRQLPRFKVGDYVKVTDDRDDHYGLTGRIKSISGKLHHVVFDPASHDFYYEDELERSSSSKMDEDEEEVDPKDYIMGLSAVYGYVSIVFAENADADMAFHILDNDGEDAVIDYLAQWDMGEGEFTKGKPWGSSDRLYRHGDYILTWNRGLSYISLNRIIREFSPEAKRYRDKEL